MLAQILVVRSPPPGSTNSPMSAIFALTSPFAHTLGQVSKRFDARVAGQDLPVNNDTIDEMLDYTRDGIWEDVVAQVLLFAKTIPS